MSHSLTQIFKFIVMGGLAAFVHGLVLFMCVSQFAIDAAWANVIAFSIAFIVSFLGHSWVTFRQNISQKKLSKNLKRLGRWLISSIFGFIVNQGLFMLGLMWLGEDYYLFIWFVVTAMVTVLSFILGKLWAFKS